MRYVYRFFGYAEFAFDAESNIRSKCKQEPISIEVS